MSELRVAVIVGSTRPGRMGRAVAEWIAAQAASRADAQYELVDLIDYPLPHLDEALPAALGQYEKDHTRAWAAKIAQYDGFVFVTPEYNHSISGVLKNAIDYLQLEWNNKAAALVGYGALGATRAVEHLRGVLSEVQIAHVRQTAAFSLFTDFKEMKTFAPANLHQQYLPIMFTQLESWAKALKIVRQEQASA